MHTREEKLQAFGRLLDILEELRVKCPWDREQTFDSLRTNTIEECFELTDAIADHDMANIKKELGDVLLHIVFYAKIASETGDFDICDVCNALCEKFCLPPPAHIRPGGCRQQRAGDAEWEKLKLKEKGGNRSVLAGVPRSLPALIKAHRIQDKVRSVGFDWEQRDQVWNKVAEEYGELKAEVASMDEDRMEAEFGDLLFSLVNAARLYGINPENALERTNRKFIKRFNYLESRTLAQGKDLKQMSLAEMDAIWEEAKKEE